MLPTYTFTSRLPRGLAKESAQHRFPRFVTTGRDMDRINKPIPSRSPEPPPLRTRLGIRASNRKAYLPLWYGGFAGFPQGRADRYKALIKTILTLVRTLAPEPLFGRSGHRYLALRAFPFPGASRSQTLEASRKHFSLSPSEPLSFRPLAELCPWRSFSCRHSAVPVRVGHLRAVGAAFKLFRRWRPRERFALTS